MATMKIVFVLFALCACGAVAQFPDIPAEAACVNDLLNLPSTKTPQCTSALLYLAGLYNDFQSGALDPQTFNASTVDRARLCACAVLYTKKELKQVNACMLKVQAAYADRLTEEQKTALAAINLAEIQQGCCPEPVSKKACLKQNTCENGADFYSSKNNCPNICECRACPKPSTQKACQKKCAPSAFKLVTNGAGCEKICECQTCPPSKSRRACKTLCEGQGLSFDWQELDSNSCPNVCTCVGLA